MNIMPPWTFVILIKSRIKFRSWISCQKNPGNLSFVRIFVRIWSNSGKNMFLKNCILLQNLPHVWTKTANSYLIFDVSMNIWLFLPRIFRSNNVLKHVTGFVGFLFVCSRFLGSFCTPTILSQSFSEKSRNNSFPCEQIRTFWKFF